MRTLKNFQVAVLFIAMAVIPMTSAMTINCLKFGTSGYYDLTSMTNLEQEGHPMKNGDKYFTIKASGVATVESTYSFRPCTKVIQAACGTAVSQKDTRLVKVIDDKGALKCESLATEFGIEMTDSNSIVYCRNRFWYSNFNFQSNFKIK